jgi:EPS-associated MarR family transcriptional regulator
LTVGGTRGIVHHLNAPLRDPIDTAPAATADAAQFEVLRLIDGAADLSQRELAARLGMSLGKANYLLRALIEKGFVKAQNYRNSGNKLAYLYVLTPSGMRRKAELTRLFLERKVREYESLREEIARLQEEAAREAPPVPNLTTR